mgnify:CR=1 FL=1
MATLTTSDSANTVKGNTVEKSSPDRFYIITSPLKDRDGQKIGLLSLKLSLKSIDERIQKALMLSFLILGITLIGIMLLLANNTKLFEYATLYRRLKEIDKMKDDFISMASHELRTPVTGLRGYMSLILEGTFGDIPPKIKENLALMSCLIERLANLVEDLLNVSRIEQGRIQVKMMPLDVRNSINDAIKEINIQAEQKKLSLSYAHNGNPALILADKDKLREVLINLIGNAIKYTEKGGIEIVSEEKPNSNSMEIRIKDTGIGMSAKDRDRLFEKFYRVQNEKTRDITGTGLGLWITRQLIHLMGGEIHIDSIEKVGTQATLQFPIAKAGEGPVLAEDKDAFAQQLSGSR